MILTDYFYPTHNLGWDYAKACGVSNAVLRLPETADFDITDRSHWQTVIDRLTGFGVRPIVIEPMPNCVHDHIKQGDDLRDESIEKVIRMLGVMDALDIRIICFNFMAGIGWTRTSHDIPERGGALVTGFNSANYVQSEITISEKALWENYVYFLRAVLPYAEKHGIQLALHPDDPPISPLGKVGRIMTSYQNIREAMRLVPSDYLGVTFCQATYHLMGEDLFQIVPQLHEKIRFIHFRNVRGNKYHFQETMHDNGELPMGRLIRMYQDLNLQVPIRVDHVPTMAKERDGLPNGYEATGKLFAIGYLKGLLEAAQHMEE
jgi:mannonate dehydratase